MNIRKSLSASALVLAVASTMLLGTAAPASAKAPVVIPKCSTMLVSTISPTYWAEFARINGEAGVAFTPSPELYGSSYFTLKGNIRAWGGVNCSWRLAKTTTSNFTVSETSLTKSRAATLRDWFASRGIVGVDSAPTLGGVLYIVSPTEWHLLRGNNVWIAIKARGTDLFGYTMQAATYRISELNPWIRP